MTIAGTVISLQGSATLDPAVDSQVTVIGSWTLELSRDILIFNESTTPPYVTALTFRPLAFSAGGVYIFTVTVSPSNPLNVIAPPGVNATYALNPLPYHDLLIEKVISSGECAGNETVSLTGSFDPLPNTADNYILTYTWTRFNWQRITEFSKDLTANEGTLEVDNLMVNAGNYTLTVCLTVPHTEVVDHCTTVEYFISNDGNGEGTFTT